MANFEAGTSSDAALALGGEYQVFLSFRGPDTRHGFTDFLYHNLVNVGVRVFRDDDELRIGDEIYGKLLGAINNSIIYIPVFSRTYASSKWCLWELAQIVENESKSEGKKSILPIFLDVEPDDVELKTSQYEAALLEHEKRFCDEVKVWRAALVAVGKIRGLNVESSQPRIVELVVKRVLEELQIKQKSVTEHLAGHDQVEKLRELLHVNHCDVRLIGIYGMGGIGKTTIAKVVFNQLCSHFGKRCSFLEGVRERLSKEGIVELQKKLLFDIVDIRCAKKIKDSEEGMRRIGETFPTEKVLVVLDDVDKKEHIMKLIGNSKLHSGSRIIITTRDTSILQVEEFKGEIRQYEMLKMDDGLALQLFCRHAFDTDFPCDVYRELSREIVSRMGGLPLAIEVVGSLLKWKSEAFWKETLARLKKEPEEEILKKLRISYDNLDKYQKQIFLDIACFFVNEKKTEAMYMWDDCSFYPERGIDVLSSRCLIKILDNDMFWMHDQLIDMGRQIVREESKDDLRKQSRLWIAKEALQIIGTEEKKHEVQALAIDGLGYPIVVKNKEFERLPNLRFLMLRNGTYAGDFARCRSNLRWFSWYYPKDFGVDNLYLDRLVVCKLYYVNFKDGSKAWDLIKEAPNLKVLSFAGCIRITTIPEISKCSGLERLTLENCSSLKSISSFIGNLRSLIELTIKGCEVLTDLPEEIGALVKLKHFSLSSCSKLRELPGSIENLTSLTELDLSDTIIRELPNSIGKLKSLRILRFPVHPFVDRKNHDWQLPSGITTLVNLEELDLSRRDVRGEIPVEIGELSSLKILNLERTRVCGIPRTINMLHHLQTLNLRNCHEIQELPELPTSLIHLHLESESLLSVPNLSNLINLVELLLSNYKYLGEKSKPLTGGNLRAIGRSSRLKKLQLNLLNVPAPPELASLSQLEQLTLSRLDLETLVQLPSSLLRLDFQFFSIRRAELLPLCLRLRNLRTLEFCYGEVEDIPLDGLPQLENLTVHRCKLLQRLSIPSELRKLRRVSVSSCSELFEIQVVGLSKSLESFCLYECISLTRINGLSYLKKLENFAILCCNLLTVVEGLHELESLKFLEIRECTSLRRCDIFLDSSREEILLNTSEKTKNLDKKFWRTSKKSCTQEQKVVLKLELHNEMDKQNALKIVSGFARVNSVSFDMMGKKMTVIGAINVMLLVARLKKRFHAEILSVRSVKRREVVLKVDLHDDKDMKKAVDKIIGFAGVNTIGINMDQKLTVTGDIDPLELVRKLRKWFRTDILFFGRTGQEEGR